MMGFYVISYEVYFAGTLVIHYAVNKISIDPNDHCFPAMIHINKNFLLTELMAL